MLPSIANMQLQKLRVLILFLAVLEMIFGILLIYRVLTVKYGLSLYEGNNSVDIPVDIQHYVSYWTIARPFIFSTVWVIMWRCIVKMGDTGKSLIVVTLIFSLIYYLVSIKEIIQFYQAYQQVFPNRSFLFKFYGYSEWDIIRGILLIAFAIYWTFVTRTNTTSSSK